MPTFNQNVTKTAVAEMTNPSGRDLSYSAELYLGLQKVATSSKSFAISAYSSQFVRFPITMPGIAGTYPVYLDIFSEGRPIGAYQSEDVTIIAGTTVVGKYIETTLFAPGSAKLGTVFPVELRVRSLISTVQVNIDFSVQHGGAGYRVELTPSPPRTIPAGETLIFTSVFPALEPADIPMQLLPFMYYYGPDEYGEWGWQKEPAPTKFVSIFR